MPRIFMKRQISVPQMRNYTRAAALCELLIYWGEKGATQHAGHAAPRFRRHHSFNTYSDQGRDHVVSPPKNAFHTRKAPSPLRCGFRGAAISRKLASMRERSG